MHRCRLFGVVQTPARFLPELQPFLGRGDGFGQQQKTLSTVAPNATILAVPSIQPIRSFGYRKSSRWALP
jgi:hypothetical protein